MDEPAISVSVVKRRNTACRYDVMLTSQYLRVLAIFFANWSIRIGHSSSDFAKIGNNNACTAMVKSVYEPSGPTGRILSWLL